MNNNYFKVIGINVDALSAEIVADKNVKDIDDVSIYIKEQLDKTHGTTWIIFPCSCKL